MLPSHDLPPCEHPFAIRHWQSPSLQSNGRPTQPTSDATDELFTQNSSDLQAAQTSPELPPVPLLALDELLLLLLALLLLLLVLLLPQASMAAHELAFATHALASSDSIEQTSLQFGGTCPHCFPMAAQTSAHDGLPDEVPPPPSEPDPSFEPPLHAPRREVRNKQPRTASRMFMRRPASPEAKQKHCLESYSVRRARARGIDATRGRSSIRRPTAERHCLRGVFLHVPARLPAARLARAGQVRRRRDLLAANREAREWSVRALLDDRRDPVVRGFSQRTRYARRGAGARSTSGNRSSNDATRQR